MSPLMVCAILMKTGACDWRVFDGVAWIVESIYQSTARQRKVDSIRKRSFETLAAAL